MAKKRRTKVQADLMLQEESIRGEGRWHVVEPLTKAGREALVRYPGETAFSGKSAKRNAELALKKICKKFPDLIV